MRAECIVVWIRMAWTEQSDGALGLPEFVFCTLMYECGVFIISHSGHLSRYRTQGT